MATTEDARIALATLASLLGIWWVFVLYRDYCVDKFREHVFALRGELFDEAAAGLVDFNDPAYGMLRSTMNGFIRFGHRLGFLQIFLTVFAFGKEAGSFPKKWGQASKDLAPDVRTRLESYLDQLNIYVIRHIVWSSLFFLITIILPLIVIFFANRIFASLASGLKPAVESIDSAALVCGEP